MKLSNTKEKLFLLTRSASLYILSHFYIKSVFSTSLNNVFFSYFPLWQVFRLQLLLDYIQEPFPLAFCSSHMRTLSLHLYHARPPPCFPAGTRAVTGAVLQDVLLAASRRKPGLCHCHLINGKVLGPLKKMYFCFLIDHKVSVSYYL